MIDREPRLPRAEGDRPELHVPDVFPDREKTDAPPTPSADPIMDQPVTAYEMVNKYGTYNIQPTSDTDNLFPTIAAGLAKPSAYAKNRRKKK